jgi:hypothetical protein
MSLLGKILAILNVFGVIAFVVLAGMVFAKRQSWAHAVHRQDLAINGLPLSADEVDPQGVPQADKFSNLDRKELFPTGEPVLNQEDEVRRLQNQVTARVRNQAGDPLNQMLTCTTILEPFAQTAAEQERYAAYRKYLAAPDRLKALKAQLAKAFETAKRTMRQPPAEHQKRTFREAFDEALFDQTGWTGGPFVDGVFAALGRDPAKVDAAEFDAAFDRALEKQRNDLVQLVQEKFTDALKSDKQGEKRSEEQRKRRIAHLLFCLVAGGAEAAPQPAGGAEDLTVDPAFRRFTTVVGVRAAVEAVRQQAATLGQIASELQTEWGRQQSTFAVRHARVLDRLRDRARQVEAENAQIKKLNDLVNAHEEQLKKKRVTVKTYQDDLAEARDQTAKDVKELRDLAALLHKERLKLRDAMDTNQKLEKQIRTAEEGR